jgi:hypothetical protein
MQLEEFVRTALNMVVAVLMSVGMRARRLRDRQRLQRLRFRRGEDLVGFSASCMVASYKRVWPYAVL